jgi:hypothetical protein
MLRPGYYAVFKELVLTTSQGRRARVHKRDWLVTDGTSIGRFDRARAMDWVPLEWASGQPVLLDEELSAQLTNACVPTSFVKLEDALMNQLDLGDGSPVPEMPRPSLREGLGTYLRTRSAAAISYQR